jgi:uncharacterized protein YbjT (DUF2867 family)
MKVLIYGATGMVGRGVLRECLEAPDVELVQVIGRSAIRQQHPKLRELLMSDPGATAGIEDQLRGYDACFFCLGGSSAGMSEAQYTRLTYELTLNVAQTLARLNPRMSFVYVSGAGADSSEKGRSMWARVRGRTENALFGLPFRSVFVFRPGLIEPLHGIRSRTRAYRLAYTVLRPLFPLLHALLGDLVLTTAAIGQAMLTVVRRGAPKALLEARDINALIRERPALPPRPMTLPRVRA